MMLGAPFYGMARWQGPMEDHTALLGRIVDIGAELFAMSATVVYTQTQMREHPERAAETQELAKALCNQAQHRTAQLFHELWSNADASNHRLALDILKGRHTWGASLISALLGTKLPGISFDCRCTNQLDEVVIEGTTKVIAPTEKVRRPRVALRDVHLHEHGVLFSELVAHQGIQSDPRRGGLSR